MLNRRLICMALAAIFFTAVIIQQAQAGKVKKLVAAYVIAKSLKPRFVPLPIPIPFKLKINKGDKYVPYPVHSMSHDSYGGGGGGMMGYGGGGMMGYGGGGMMGGMMGGYD